MTMNRNLWMRFFLLGTLLISYQHSNAGQLNQPFGLGIVAGDPTAITGKYWLHQDDAVDFGLAFSVNDATLLYGDYLVHYPGAFKQKGKFINELNPYVGVGGVLAATSSSRSDNYRYYGRSSGSLGLGVRVPFGVEWQPVKPPLGIFAEIVPGISVVPTTGLVVQGGIGIRYYF